MFFIMGGRRDRVGLEKRESTSGVGRKSCLFSTHRQGALCAAWQAAADDQFQWMYPIAVEPAGKRC